MNIKLDFNNIKVKESKKDFTVKILMLKGEKGEQGDLNHNDVIDNLTSTDNTKVLSAKQGKVLNDLLNKKPYYFNTVADMKAGQLSVGDYVITKGYYSTNDGGGAEYNIVSTTSNYSETLNNNLKAELIIKDSANVKQFGAKGDNTNDDTTAIQNALDYSSNVFIPEGNYKISSITINKYQHLYGIYTKSKLTSEQSKSIIIPRASDNCYLHDFSSTGGIELGVTGTAEVQDMNCTLENIECTGGYGFHISQRGQSLINCKSGGTQYGFHIIGTDNIITNCVSSTTDTHGFAITGPNNIVSCCKAFLAGRNDYGAGFFLTGAFCRLGGCEAQQNFYENYFIQNSFSSNISGCLSDGAFWSKSDISQYNNPILGAVNTSSILLHNINSIIVDITNINGSIFSSTSASANQVLSIPYPDTLHKNSININSYIRNDYDNIMTDIDLYRLVTNNDISGNGINYNSLITKRIKTTLSHSFEENVVETNVRLGTIKIPTNSLAVSLYFPSVSDKTYLENLFWDIMITYVDGGVTKYKNISNQNISTGNNSYYNIQNILDTINVDTISDISLRFIATNKSNSPDFTFEINDMVICPSISNI